MQSSSQVNPQPGSRPRLNGPQVTSRQFITDIAATYLISPTVAADSSPLSLMGASWFSDAVQEMLKAQGLGDGSVQGVSVEDWLVYHALLYSSSQTILAAIPEEYRARLCSMLAAPSMIAIVTQSKQFGMVRSKVRSLAARAGLSIGQWVAKKAARKAVMALLDKYTPLPWIRALRKDPKEVLSNVWSQTTEALSEKRENAERLIEDSVDYVQTGKEMLAGGGLRGLASEDALDLAIRAAEVAGRARRILSVPSFKPTKPKRSQLSLVRRSIAVAGMAGYAMPEALPLLMASPDQSGAELGLRVIGPVIAYGSGYPVTTALVIEVAARLLPKSIRNSKFSMAITRPMSKKWESLLKRWEGCCAALRRDLHDRSGLKHRQIDMAHNAFVQMSLATVAGGLVGDTHPLWTALGATSFVQYIGLMGANAGLLAPESVTSQSAYLELVPLQVAMGLGASALEETVGLPRGVSSHVVTLLSVPTVVDWIASSGIYQRLVIRPLANRLVPKIKQLRRLRVGSKLMQIADHLKLPGRGKAKLAAVVVGAGIAGYKGYKTYHKRITQVGLKAMSYSLKKLAQGYSGQILIATVAPYIGGPEMGLAAAVLVGRADATAAVAHTSGLMTLAATGSPFLASVAVGVTDDVVRTLGVVDPIVDRAANASIVVANKAVRASNTVGRAIVSFAVESAIDTAVDMMNFFGWLFNDGSQ